MAVKTREIMSDLRGTLDDLRRDVRWCDRPWVRGPMFLMILALALPLTLIFVVLGETLLAPPEEDTPRD